MKFASILLFFLCTLGIGVADTVQKDEHKKLELTPQVNSYAGLYRCIGKDGPDEYEYTVKVIKAGKTYVVHWVSDTGQIFSGLGILKNDKLNIALHNKGVTTLYVMERKGDNFEGEYCSMHHDGTRIVRVQVDSSRETWTLIRRFE